MDFCKPIEFKEVINIIKSSKDRGVSYCVYSEIFDSDELKLDTICYLDNYPEITDDDEEIYSDFVEDNSLNLLFREELVQDVILNVLRQKTTATEQEILEAIVYYDNNDCFKDFC